MATKFTSAFVDGEYGVDEKVVFMTIRWKVLWKLLRNANVFGVRRSNHWRGEGESSR